MFFAGTHERIENRHGDPGDFLVWISFTDALQVGVQHPSSPASLIAIHPVQPTYAEPVTTQPASLDAMSDLDRLQHRLEALVRQAQTLADDVRLLNRLFRARPLKVWSGGTDTPM